MAAIERLNLLRVDGYGLRGFVRLRRGLRGGGDGDFMAAGVERLREWLDEALRRAGDQGELHVVPVGADGVVDDCPALHDGARDSPLAARGKTMR